MTIFSEYEVPTDSAFQSMSGKIVTDSQIDLIDVLSDGLGDACDILEMVAAEMKKPVDRQVASVAISILKAGGKPVSIIRHRLLEKVHGQGGLF